MNIRVLSSVLMLALFLACGSRSRPKGVLVPEAPLQESLPSPITWTHKGMKMDGLAHYNIRARVLSRERYYFDQGATISPLDLALGWGPMSDTRNLDVITVTQHSRWYFWHTPQWIIPREIIESHSANVHILPANTLLERRVKALRIGDVTRMEGKLVSISGPNGYTWRSSLSRNDTGDGSCEVFWVEKLDWPPQ